MFLRFTYETNCNNCRYLSFTATNNIFFTKRGTSEHEVTTTKKIECIPAPYQGKCLIEPSVVDPNNLEPHTVIIGAGIAGLSATRRLVQCGITNFTVLEAREKPGGRIHSCWLGDSIAEMGTQYTEGEYHTFTTTAQEDPLKSTLRQLDPNKDLLATNDCRGISQPACVTAYHLVSQIEHEVTMLFSQGCHGTIMDFVGTRIQQELRSLPENIRYDAARAIYAMANIMTRQCGEDLSNVSADNISSVVEILGGSVRLPLGSSGLLAALLRDIPEYSIKYCKAVENIRWGTTGSPRAIVTCYDGEEYEADYVLITVSLGVLKAMGNSLFCPALPAEKTEAIRKLGYGYVNKIFLEYYKQFWFWREGQIKFSWSADQLADKTDWVKGLCSIEELAGSQHVLEAWVRGQEALNMEKCSEEEIAESITRLLRQITKDPSLPYPSRVITSKWCSDPYFQGSYSYLGANSTVGHQRELGAPIPAPCENFSPILLFAGEATCPEHYSTVLGARLSGIREAERIVQMTKRYRGPPPKF